MQNKKENMKKTNMQTDNKKKKKKKKNFEENPEPERVYERKKYQENP